MNLELVRKYYENVINQGYPDEANNVNFCLEYNQGVEQDIELVAEYYKIAINNSHSKEELNYQQYFHFLNQ
jgi:TPR repeat protein